MISITVPTFNESENIVKIIPRIHKCLKNEKHEIIVVDDNSPDKTYETAKKLGKKYPVRVILRKNKKDLGSAILRGFKESRGEIVGVIDADLQHPPEKIPELLKALRNGADISVGSRWVKGGRLQDWPWYRVLISRSAWLLSYPLEKTKDSMSGFFLMKKKVIEGVDLNPIGYKLLLEILIKGKHKRVVEVPYTFKKREVGLSNLNSVNFLKYLVHLIRLYKYKLLKK